MSVVPGTNTYYYIQSQLNTGLVVDISGTDKQSDPGAPIVTWQKEDGAAASASQLWYLVDAGSGYYYIHSKMNDFVLGVTGGGGPGTHVINDIRDDGVNQRWKLIEEEGVTFIQSALPGNLVMDIEGASSVQGTAVIMWPKKEKSTGSENQEWKLVPAGTTEPD